MPIKVLFDTNVLVSALLVLQGPARALVELAWRNRIVMVVSQGVLTELRDVLQRPQIAKKYSVAASAGHFVDSIEKFAQVSPGEIPVEVELDDPRDRHVLAGAVEAQCQFIVTGDQHLLRLAEYQGIRVVTPRVLLTELEAVRQD